MTTHAKGTFEYQGWDEKTWDGKPAHDVKGAKMTYAQIKNKYEGDIEGESESRLLMNYTEDGSAVYSGFEKITGKLGGKSGSFVVHADGGYETGKQASWTWSIVPGSGTGELKGIRGKGTATAESHVNHTPYTLDYDFE